jgi:hypothetical protein
MPICQWRRVRRTQDLRLAYGGLREISGAGEAQGVLLHCHANVQNGSIGAAANSETADDSGEHAKADRDSPEFFVLRRVNESRRGSACGLGSARIPAHPRHHTRFINSAHV